MKIPDQIRKYKVEVFYSLIALVILEFIFLVVLMIQMGNLNSIISNNNKNDNSFTPTTNEILNTTVAASSTTKPTSTPSTTPISLLVNSTGRTSLSIDLAKQDNCKDLNVSANLPAGTLVESTLNSEDGVACLSVMLYHGSEDSLSLSVFEPGDGCMDMTRAIEVGKLSNGETVYKVESPEDFKSYSYHTIWDQSNQGCPGSSMFASLTEFGGMAITCSKDSAFCDNIVKSIEINDKMNVGR